MAISKERGGGGVDAVEAEEGEDVGLVADAGDCDSHGRHCGVQDQSVGCERVSEGV